MAWLIDLATGAASMLVAATDLITALATLVLALLTGILAWYTKRLAAASSSPHVMVSLEPSRWSLIYFDLHVANTGNAAAYDVRVNFDPPLPSKDGGGAPKELLTNISALRPGQKITSFAASYKALREHTFTVKVSWAPRPNGRTAHNSYRLSVAEYEHLSHLGSGDPLVQIANEMKTLREDWQRVTKNGKRLSIDVYDTADRRRSEEELERFREERRSRRSANAARHEDEPGSS